MRLSKGPVTPSQIRALKPGSRISDSRCQGLGVRCRGGGKTEWTLRFTSPITGRVREALLSSVENTTSGKVVALARRMRGEVQKGVDPLTERSEARSAEKARVTLTDFRATYQRVTTKKDSTVRSDTALFDLHVLPVLGEAYIDAITPADVQRLHDKLSLPRLRPRKKNGAPGRAIAGPTRANRAVALLSHVLAVAARRGLRPAGPLPRGSVTRNSEVKRDRFLTPEQMRDLAIVLDEMGTGPHREAAAALRLLMLTGCRKGEVKDLAWSEVNFDKSRLELADSKTGKKEVSLSASALTLLRLRHESRRPSPFVFPAEDGKSPRADLDTAWRIVRGKAGVPWCRIHDLRHSYAAAAVTAGMSLPQIGALLGHKAAATTARYAHVANAVRDEAATRVGAHLDAIFAATKPKAATRLRRVK